MRVPVMLAGSSPLNCCVDKLDTLFFAPAVPYVTLASLLYSLRKSHSLAAQFRY